MIDCPSVNKQVIRFHYDLSTVFYRLLWGPHIHHGLWKADESPRRAQQQLTETLCHHAAIRAGERVLDVGCGMGASSIHLAQEHECQVVGVTLSRLQCAWAATSSRLRGAANRTKFLRTDAEQLSWPDGSFDVVWSIECTEHLYDKPAFFERAARWLRPGGRMAICAWLAGDDPLNQTQRQMVYDVCEGFFCPSLGAEQDYIRWFEQAGLQMERSEDWTQRVAATWEICRRRVQRTGLRTLASIFDRDTAMFLDRFKTILEAYQTGAMRYGCFVARKP